MKPRYQSITGFKDILPDTIRLWQEVEHTARDCFKVFGYREIRTPTLEKTELFERSIGETTDIVEKEMYTFRDRDGESLTLRPEGTAPVVRAYIEHSLGARDSIFKVYYIGPMFRHERPQKGRFRQFHQIGAEIFNVQGPSAEVELLMLIRTLFEKLNVRDTILQINSIGCPDCRPAYIKILKRFIEANLSGLCSNCRKRKELNPMRVLDCKEENCNKIIKKAPVISEHLCDSCLSHLTELKNYINESGIEYELNPKLVRGLDYYTKTAFEIVTKQGGSQNAIVAGGRYDNLVEVMGGSPTPAAGFAIGIERLIRVSSLPITEEPISPLLYIASVGNEALHLSCKIALILKRSGIYAETSYAEKSLKSQMRRADKLGAWFVLIIGEDELKSGSAILRNMRNSKQQTVQIRDIDRLITFLRDNIRIPQEN